MILARLLIAEGGALIISAHPEQRCSCYMSQQPLLGFTVLRRAFRHVYWFVGC